MCLKRINTNGTFDTTFGNDTALTKFRESNACRVHALPADGKIIVGGACRLSAAPTVKQFCLFRYEGGPEGYRACSLDLDLDGDGSVLATTGALMMTRISLGMTGNAVTSGITFPSGATRLGWVPIRNYLVSQCGITLAP